MAAHDAWAVPQITVAVANGSRIALRDGVAPESFRQGVRVLVVDDEPAIRALLRKIIQRRGYDVDDAADGAVAIELLDKKDYEVVLIDLMMPNVNGFQLVEYLASRGEDRHRPAAIVITAAAESTPLRQLDPRIVHSVIRKPFDIDVVAELVDAVAATRGERREETDRPLNVINFPGC
jgi:CheY-like chemotaxis protein